MKSKLLRRSPSSTGSCVRAPHSFPLLTLTCAIVVMGYCIAVVVFCILAGTRGHSAWNSSVKETNFFAPAIAPTGYGAGQPQYKNEYPPQAPQGYGSPPPQGYPQAAPQQHPAYTVRDPPWFLWMASNTSPLGWVYPRLERVLHGLNPSLVTPWFLWHTLYPLVFIRSFHCTINITAPVSLPSYMISMRTIISNSSCIIPIVPFLSCSRLKKLAISVFT
jgi:hypothetical protein